MFKQALSYKEAAISLIEQHVPDSLKYRIDTSTVKVEKILSLKRILKNQFVTCCFQ